MYEGGLNTSLLGKDLGASVIEGSIRGFSPTMGGNFDLKVALLRSRCIHQLISH
jgi:hypothetical protein